MIAYRAMADVLRELVHYLGRLLYAKRPVRGTRTGTRALTCFRQAPLVLVWFRRDEDLHTALRRAAADGGSHVILDGFSCARISFGWSGSRHRQRSTGLRLAP